MNMMTAADIQAQPLCLYIHEQTPIANQFRNKVLNLFITPNRSLPRKASDRCCRLECHSRLSVVLPAISANFTGICRIGLDADAGFPQFCVFDKAEPLWKPPVACRIRAATDLSRSLDQGNNKNLRSACRIADAIGFAVSPLQFAGVDNAHAPFLRASSTGCKRTPPIVAGEGHTLRGGFVVSGEKTHVVTDSRSHREVDSDRRSSIVRLQTPTLETTMQVRADRPEAPSAIRSDLGAIFVSWELSRSIWLITSLSPGAGEKMPKHSALAGDRAIIGYHRFLIVVV
jgi:hypothetical protein